MTPDPYYFSVAFRSLLKEKWINLLSILTIAAGLIIVSISFFIGYNIDAATKTLPERFSMMVYFANDLPDEERDRTVSQLRKHSAVRSARFISKDEARDELKRMLKDSEYVFEGLEENPLPDALELRLKKEAVGPEKAREIAEEALKMKGVREVDYGEQFVSTLHQLKAGVKTIGMILIAILSTGIIFVCYSTVKILFYRKTDEIETFKLLGATKAFIRAPFLVEGGVIGTAGGLISLASVYAFYYIVIQRLALTMPLFKRILFPSDLFLLLPLLGLFLGLTGAAIALGRLKY